jgi:hypothetical protein
MGFEVISQGENYFFGMELFVPPKYVWGQACGYAANIFFIL